MQWGYAYYQSQGSITLPIRINYYLSIASGIISSITEPTSFTFQGSSATQLSFKIYRQDGGGAQLEPKNFYWLVIAD